MEQKTQFQRAQSGFPRFDPIVVVRDVFRRCLLILLAAAVVGVGSGVLAKVLYVPSYVCKATMAVGTPATVSDLPSAAALAGEFADLLNTDLMHRLILEEAGIADFEGNIAAKRLPETNLVTLQVTCSDPEIAFRVAQAVVEGHSLVTDRVMGEIILEILDAPEVPTEPINSLNAAFLAVRNAAFAAVAMIAVLAYLSLSRDTVRSGREARQKLTCAYLGEIPNRGKKPAQYTQSIRKLCCRVEKLTSGGKVLMVTSLLEGEGTTTVAADLALSMKRYYDRVLLMDGHLLSAQKTEGICSDGMEKLLSRARENYDFVVLDLPPVSLAPDAEIAMEYADASLLVVRQNEALAPELNKAAAVLQKGSAKFLGCVLNDVHETLLLSGRGYRKGGQRL